LIQAEIRSKIFGGYGMLFSKEVLTWIWAVIAFRRPVFIARALIAYGFEVRHAVDVDHIATIDKVIRKLMQEKNARSPVYFCFT